MKSIITAAVFFSTITLFAQTQTENFESNSWGWTETSSKDGEAVIKDGVFHLEGKRVGAQYVLGTGQYAVNIRQAPSFVETHCYAAFDPTKNFEIKCSATIKKISDNGNFGLMLDFQDDGNFIVFQVRDDEAWLVRYENSERSGRIRNLLKQNGKKQVSLDISIKSTYQKLQFFINGMMVVEARYLPITTNGFGFYVEGNQTVDFDNVVITQ